MAGLRTERCAPSERTNAFQYFQLLLGVFCFVNSMRKYRLSVVRGQVKRCENRDVYFTSCRGVKIGRFISLFVV